MSIALVPAAAGAEHAPAKADKLACTGAEAPAGTAPAAQVERTVLCLVNGYRRAEGSPSLHLVHALRDSARSYARLMVADQFFGHVDLEGHTLESRLRAHHYFTDETRRWSAAENIAMAGGELATARHIVGDWMGSPAHRANILRRGLRDIGVGVVPGSPRPTGIDPVTVVIDLGSRH